MSSSTKYLYRHPCITLVHLDNVPSIVAIFHSLNNKVHKTHFWFSSNVFVFLRLDFKSSNFSKVVMVGQPFAAKGPHEKCKALRVFWHNFRDLGKNNLFFLFYERFLQFEVWSKNGFEFFHLLNYVKPVNKRFV